MPKSYFDSLHHFIKRRYRLVIIAWVVAVMLSLVLIPSFFSSVSYNLTGGFGGPSNTMSVKAANIVQAQFPNSNSSDASILVVVQGASVYSDSLKQSVLALNDTISKDTGIGNYTGESSLYSLETSILNSSVPEILNQAASLQSNIIAINSGLYSLQDNLSESSTNLYANMTTAESGFSVSDLMEYSYQLGPSPTETQTWDLACALISNATQNTFSDSPLYTIDNVSLTSLLSGLSPNATTDDVNFAINNLITTQSYADYPYVPLSALSGNFVNSQNNTMLIVLGFSSNPDANTIANVESDVKNSGLQNFGSVYVTGGSVLSQDVEKAMVPALEITIGPAIAISLLIVGLLFFAPVAALIPVLLGGISVSVALASIYVSVVDIGHGTLTFLTPTLTILLMLGLAVDYSVLQLRRTREERQKGKSTEESVGTSIKWAGQAVLTAGITVIVAYIVMAVANVPIFSDVGTAIAIGVSVLLTASLTLLPALEIALGDRIFWPGLIKEAKAHSDPNQNILRRLGHKTLKRKIPIVIIISVVVLSAFVVMYNAPTSEDFLRLIPNFPSNQGLTVLADSFGSGVTAPTSIVVTTPTPITYGDNQFNQTLLDQIEQITAAAISSKGVATVSGPTRPYGNVFNYSSVENMSEPLSMQYESQMFSAIGTNNKTAVITVGLLDSAQSAAAINYLREMEKNINQLPLINGVAVYFGGETQSAYDNHAFMISLIPEVVVILAAAVYVILFLQLRSAFTPLRLIITILCSVVFSLAIISITFYFALNVPILDFAPLFVVVTMLGVGIDYDIFFLTRIREEVLNGKTDNEAIVTAIDKVWVTIVGLGLVLATVFASLIITNIPMLQEISLAVASAILIDVTVVILFFVPALMGLAQKFNWWPYKLSKSVKSTF
ncbi:MAG: MMPL family transporter [Candidatus Bathyarchaeia archaeon]|jgi:RND superfamily putative drug exporter